MLTRFTLPSSLDPVMNIIRTQAGMHASTHTSRHGRMHAQSKVKHTQLTKHACTLLLNIFVCISQKLYSHTTTRTLMAALKFVPRCTPSHTTAAAPRPMGCFRSNNGV